MKNSIIKKSKQDNYQALKTIIDKKNIIIQQLKKENDELKDKIQLLDNIIAVTPNHVYWKDEDGVYLGCNDEQARTLGFESGKEVVGKTDAQLPWQAGADIFRKVDLEVMTKHKVVTVEEKSKLPNGQEVTYLSSKRPLYDPSSGKVIGVLGISVDISDIAQKLLIEQERVSTLETLSGSIAHELRTPLGAITNFLTLLQTDLPQLLQNYQTQLEANFIVKRKINDLQKIPQLMQQSVDNAQFIIRMLLMNINQAKISPERFNEYSMQQTIKEALEEYPLSPAQRTKIHWHKQPDFTYRGEATLTKHVLFNLLKNALYYIEDAGKGDIDLQLDTTSEADYNVLWFKDTAKGIAADYLPYVFEKFQYRRPGGTGLGLAFCRLVLQAYGGAIECDSVEGEYTQFKLSLPRVKGA